MSTEDGAVRDLVVIGASAGGVETLTRIVSRLPADLAASVCIVLHIAPSSPSALAGILGRAGPLKCRQATGGEALVPGEILVAPPDHHLVIEDDHAHLTVGPRENGHRPSIDTLFRSASKARNGQVIGVVLSGNRDDGAAGLATIKARGGAAIVQDPDEALYSGMPASAIASVTVDEIARSDDIASAIARLVRTADPPPEEGDGSETSSSDDEPMLACPECGGVLQQKTLNGVPQWRCQVGHRYSIESLVDEQAGSVEAALWTAVRALEERASLLERMADQCEARDQPRSARSFRRKSGEAHAQSELVRTALRRAAESTLREISAADAEEVDQQAT
jgi:two-component system chemotaxis response regulator CheB